MNWIIIPREERLLLWKKLRKDIASLPLGDQLSEVAKFCANIPFGSRTIDYYSPTEWPTPWEILFHGSFCTSSISLLIFYTLSMVPVSARVDLYLVEDDNGVYLLPVIDDLFVLNYELGSVNKYPNDCADIKVLKIYSQDQIKIIN